MMTTQQQDRVWIQHTDEPDEWTWCFVKINDEDWEYVSIDRIAALEAALALLSHIASEAHASLSVWMEELGHKLSAEEYAAVERLEDAIVAALDAARELIREEDK